MPFLFPLSCRQSTSSRSTSSTSGCRSNARPRLGPSMARCSRSTSSTSGCRSNGRPRLGSSMARCWVPVGGVVTTATTPTQRQRPVHQCASSIPNVHGEGYARHGVAGKGIYNLETGGPSLRDRNLIYRQLKR
jgi:hypothetical protein